MSEAVLRADLHVHSDHSGLKHLRFLRMRDCYAPALDVYRRAKARGMDLVTLTDHDTIDGCLEIRERLGDPPDFFMSEEVETFLPGKRSMHIGVFGITEQQHREIQRLRRDFETLVAYLDEQRIVSALNHLFRGYRPGLDVAGYLAPLVGRFDLFETRNGTQSARYRELTEKAIALLHGAGLSGAAAGCEGDGVSTRSGVDAADCPGEAGPLRASRQGRAGAYQNFRPGRPGAHQASRHGQAEAAPTRLADGERLRPLAVGETGGSDAHTLARVGRTWTECPGPDREAFLENLAAGRGRAAGEDGRLLPLARDVYSIVLSYYGTLVGRGRVKFAPGERWPGVLFCLATLPSQLIGFPFLATSWNLALKRIGLARIAAEMRALERPAGAAAALRGSTPQADPDRDAEAPRLLPEPES